MARAVLRSVAGAKALLGELAGRAAVGRVRISAPTAFVRTCLVPILPGLLASHPDILLDLRASDTMVDLADAGIDLAICSGSLDSLPGHIRLPWFVFPGWPAPHRAISLTAVCPPRQRTLERMTSSVSATPGPVWSNLGACGTVT